MAFRAVVVNSHTKLELSLGYLVSRTVGETKRVLINEIHTLIIQNTAVSLTAALICELTKKKVKIIFCDEKSNPSSEITPFYQNVFSSRKIVEQIGWSEDDKQEAWRAIMVQKIRNQAKVLRKYNLISKAEQVEKFSENVHPGDDTNREGHAAKVYFNSIYGYGFSRCQENTINAGLNYGYSLLLSQINREIVSSGYLTQLGIHHRNAENPFNLSCDLMEAFRPIIDDKVKSLNGSEEFKKDLIYIFEVEVLIDDTTQSFSNAIKIFVNSFFNAISKGDISKIKFYTGYEL